MRFGSLFAGIGGFDLGLERAGMTCAWQVEIDDFCNRVLEKHWPNVKRYRDVREVGKHNLPPVDLICGGFPCQPFSVAGKQRGKEDDRHLWPEMFRVISELRPTWVVGENVSGLVRLGLDEVLSDLEGIGYSTQTFDIPACAVDAPHVRHRIWIVGHAEVGAVRAGLCEGGKREVRRGRSCDTSCKNVAHAGCQQPSGRDETKEGQQYRRRRQTRSKSASCGDVAHAYLQGPQGRARDGVDAGEQQFIFGQGDSSFGGNRLWLPEPELGRVAHGIPRRVDRLRSLGNAVVPQVVEVIGRAIMAARPPRGRVPPLETGGNDNPPAAKGGGIGR